jgi:hypothetical protein
MYFKKKTTFRSDWNEYFGRIWAIVQEANVVLNIQKNGPTNKERLQ